ncbi:hypothetical protein ACH5RR_039217 [Cinchona calisaya]|uniref:Integrase zinc-binding domain-containing protein n=1 Tax=Cinchona calisaya TaxID=153742 RepID=A0ABD2Y132_9GENT
MQRTLRKPAQTTQVHLCSLEATAQDALSRTVHPAVEEDPVTLCAISSISSTLVTKIKNTWQFDQKLSSIIHAEEQDPLSHPHYAWEQGILKRKGKIVVGAEVAIRDKLLQYFNSSTTGGHFGVHATYQGISAIIHWKGLHSAVRQFIKTCHTCQINKYEIMAYPGLLQPLPILEAF